MIWIGLQAVLIQYTYTCITAIKCVSVGENINTVSGSCFVEKVSVYVYIHKQSTQNGYLSIHVQPNLPERPPPMTGHLFCKGTLWRTVCVNSYLIQPSMTGHLSWQVTFSMKKGWPVKTGYTVCLEIKKGTCIWKWHGHVWQLCHVYGTV